MKIDLHCHTSLSNGSLQTDAIVKLASGCGIDVISISDHDDLTGINRAYIVGKAQNIKVIPAVELSSYDEETDQELHFIAYGIKNTNLLESICYTNTATRTRVMKLEKMLLLSTFGVPGEIVDSCISKPDVIFPQHILHAAMLAGIDDKIYGEVYDKLIEAGRFAPIRKFPAPQFVINQIHNAGGVAVLAHPGLLKDISVIDKLIMKDKSDEDAEKAGFTVTKTKLGKFSGIDGIEVNHPAADAQLREKLTGICKEHGLIMTGGSDFHGMYNRFRVKLGECTTDEAEYEKLLAFIE